MFIKFKIPRKPHIIKASIEILPGVAVIGPLREFFPFPPFKVRELFIISKGRSNIGGNQDIRLLSSDKLLVSYNFSKKPG